MPRPPPEHPRLRLLNGDPGKRRPAARPARALFSASPGRRAERISGQMARVVPRERDGQHCGLVS